MGIYAEADMQLIARSRYWINHPMAPQFLTPQGQAGQLYRGELKFQFPLQYRENLNASFEVFFKSKMIFWPEFSITKILYLGLMSQSALRKIQHQFVRLIQLLCHLWFILHHLNILILQLLTFKPPDK